jgi:hypothetical protein
LLVDRIFNRRPGSMYGAMGSANASAEGEWRWRYDRSAFVDEYDREKAQEQALRAAREERYRNRLSKLTWEQLLAESPFERWSPSPPFPPLAFTRSARDAVHEACKTLRSLGPKPRRADVRSILRGCVEWFNQADERAGGVIETEEREDIIAVLEEMAYVARQRGLVNEIEGWRRW